MWLPRLKGTVNQLARRLPTTQPVVIVTVVLVVLVFAVVGVMIDFKVVINIDIINVVIIIVTESHASTFTSASTLALDSGSIMCRG